MQTIEYTSHDKTGWPPGEWHREPDKRQWVDEATGLPCLIVRSTLGHLCGYVGVSEGHPLFEKDYSEADVDVHGGLTFSDHCQENARECAGICHKVEPGENDSVWWLGFDCAHSGDYSPNAGHRGISMHGKEYRDFRYVAGECARLARQLKAMKPC